MKHKIVEVKNMLRTEHLLDSLLNRSTMVPGIGLIHGPSGFGKTTAVEYLFNQDEVNGIYIRCYRTDTVTSLLEQICREIGITPRHTLRSMVDGIVEVVRRDQMCLFIDEADYIVGNSRILETLRDIYDATEQPLVLVGMEEIARRISQRKQLFNRISQWIEFKPADLDDVALIAKEMLEVPVNIDEELLDLIRRRSNGMVRTIVSALDKIEKMAMASDVDIIGIGDVDERELFHDVRRVRQ
ncbi:AAA ATPase [Tolumonas auensis DSM 9187]|uniref:AAA ATPase n=1 Tax=Tolumonas auensis (strain DSM 9187 / NBRC 110442 / TA 4) TaxID=595494 RepID=C4LBA8_TOLAT|nr:ATP-binding protein [Tolumonas auensis]ACQ92343.1 AAA ATPase [Tolumonas auensis DSM 9187]